MTEKTKIAFVGVGGMGQCAHLKNYVANDDCDVIALAEIRPELAKRVAAKYDIPKVYASHEELLANEKPDGIVASQPFSRHGVLVPDLLKAGVPLFTEKPIAASLEVGEKIVDAVAESGTWHMVGYHKRSDPATMWAKAKIDELKASGELGALKYVRITMPAGDWIAGGFSDLLESDEPFPELVTDPPPSDMDEDAFAKYKAFVNYYIHQVNLAAHLLGERYHVTFADTSGIMLSGESDSGVCCVIEMSPFATTIDWQEQALVCFEKGWIKVDLPAPVASNRPGRVRFYSDPGDAEPTLTEPQLPWVHAMRQQAHNFVSSIRGEMKPLCDAAEALEDLKVAREYLKLWQNV